jgi:Flp pilus assembly protein TadB
VRAVAICCAVLGAWTFAGPERGNARVGAMLRPEQLREPRRSLVDSPWPRGCLCAVSTAFLCWVIIGPVAAVAGVAAGLALSVWVGRLESPAAALAREQVERDLPLAVDLLAACATAGRPPEESLAVVRRAVGGALGARLGEISARLALGADPATEWTRCARDPQLSGLARAMQRSAESGAPLAEGLARLAEDHRRDRRTRNQMRARNVGVKAAAPLAACFLPAFMLVGVVPTVAGSFQHFFG